MFFLANFQFVCALNRFFLFNFLDNLTDGQLFNHLRNKSKQWLQRDSSICADLEQGALASLSLLFHFTSLLFVSINLQIEENALILDN